MDTGGQIRGKILLNGHEASDLAIRRSTGYCEQMDIHSEAATFREALTFSAFLRQSSDVSDAKKYSSVNECLDLLDMHPIADQIIRGSSTEQMKRLTIGVELAAQPSVLFLDEPTSGLDARSAKVIMDGVRKVANTGRTILCTIHQPSTEVFMLFDSLLLLRRGGETVFFGALGEDCCKLVRYFESIAGVPKLRDNYNPATWMLEVIGAGVGNANHDHDFVAVFNASTEKQALDAQMAQPGVTYPLDGIQALTFGKKRASTSTTQLKALLQRFFRMYWRTPSYNLTRFVVYLILALLFGLVFVDADYTTFQGINSGVGMIFVTTAFVGVVSFESVLPIASAERASFYRERAAQTYNALWYFVGSTLVEIPHVVTCSLIFTAIFFPMFFLYWLNTALHVLLQTYMGQFLVYALPTVEVAAIVGVLMNSIFFLFMGFNPPTNSIPAGYKWLSQITPQKYTLAILSAIVFSDCPGPESNDLGCRQLKNAPLEVGNVTVKAYVERVFEMKHKNIWTNFAVIVGMIVLFRLLALLSLRFINHQRPDDHENHNISYDNAKTLMAKGPEALHEHISARVETAMGKFLPQLELRFQNVSVSAEVVLSGHNPTQTELPTVGNHVIKALSKFSSKRTIITKEVLKNISGVFRPGTITLVLGQPGSGKSALMKILSGRFPITKSVTVDGEMTYNGTKQEDIIKRLPQFVSYVTQLDRHFPTLTVKETLQFAHECAGGKLSQRAESLFTNGTPDENKAALEAARAMFKHLPEIVIEQLGLEKCQDTIVGNAMLRGISGGERKRVTTGEMQFGMKLVTFMDEISTGLDSAATYDIIKTQRSVAKNLRKTVVISLLQPSPEVFSLFDDVLILNEGRLMYHGPCDQVQGYFRDLGFVSPPRRDVADFLLDLGTNQQHQYEVRLPHGEAHPRTPREFADLFESSEIHAKTLQSLYSASHPALVKDTETHMNPVPEFQETFWHSTKTLMIRQHKLTIRNRAFLMGRALMVVLMGLLYGSTFFDMNEDNAQVVMGVIFASALFLALGQASQIPTFMAAREVFYKQRGANFYRTASYVLANSVAQIPLALAESVLFGSLVYWMCGFVSTAGAYIAFIAMLVLTNLAFAAWFFFLAAAAPDLHIAKPAAMVSVLFYILFAGFVVTKDNIPGYMEWIYWINPIAWCIRALSVNQYRDSKFDVCVYNGVNYCALHNGKTAGLVLLDVFQVPPEKHWLPYGFAFMAVTYASFMFFSYFVLEYMRYESPENISFTAEEMGIDDEHNPQYHALNTPKPGNSCTAEVVLPISEARDKNFTPVVIAFQDLWYSVPHPSNPSESIDLLKGISGYAKPGTMTALMGSSGAGKTTLMDVIAGRKTGGQIRGKILLNGHEASDLAVRRATGYCEQMDIHSEAATFREAFTFSAFLRQSSDIPDAKKYDSVNECLDLLDMHSIADQIIRGSSTEQMKRLTIGVELAAQPSVIFLDEPTSGLDARSAKVIMDGVRKVANTGRTILCTIHQPSTEVFALFDSLLLLKRGGETIFFGELGEDSCELIRYFEAVPGVDKIRDGYNPATWMLEVTGAGVGHQSQQDFVAVFKDSEQKRMLDFEMDQEGFSKPSTVYGPIVFSGKRAATNSTQFKFLMRRYFHMYWRTPSYNLTRFLIAMVLAILFGLVYLDAEYKSYQGINGGVGMVFLTMGFIGIVSFNSVLPLACEERASFYRERACQTYNALWYFMASTYLEIPYVFGSSFLFTVIFFPMVGFTGYGRFFFYWIVLSMHVLLQTYIGQFLSYAMPSVEVAAIIGVLLNSIFFLFMGFNPPAMEIPSGYKWIYHITPHKYSLSILTATVFSKCEDGSELGCTVMTGVPAELGVKNITIKQYVEHVFKMESDDIWKHFGILVVFIIAFRILGLLSLRYINHQKR
uniref:ABC transporter domain-containing protein n=1 Tax=Lagenidium giganteum TaxID=4803 RepID=A0AAV2Z7R7_9STRA